MEQQIIHTINKDLAIALPDDITADELLNRLSIFINELIKTSFDKLILVLYRVDVNEHKLKTLLKENKDKDAGKIIAALIIERQLQKIRSRQQFSEVKKDIDENEKW